MSPEQVSDPAKSSPFGVKYRNPQPVERSMHMRVIAHRGSAQVWPENTMLAFDYANDHGASGFEIDLQLSADGEIVLCHDDNLKRFGLKQITISQQAVADLARVEISSLNGQYRDHLMTLRQLLQKYPDKHYTFDCKGNRPAMIRHLRQLIDELAPDCHCWFLGWSQEINREIERLFPNSHCYPGYWRSWRWGVLSLLGLGNYDEPDHPILALPASFHGRKVFRKEQVRAIKQRQKQFVAYLVNTEAELKYCLDCEVDTILTDRPDKIKQFLDGW